MCHMQITFVKHKKKSIYLKDVTINLISPVSWFAEKRVLSLAAWTEQIKEFKP